MEEVSLQQLVCKNCGGEIDLGTAEAGVVFCRHCRAAFTLPKREQQPAVLSFLRMGEHGLSVCDFEGAFSAYEKAAVLDPSEPEAFFGKALSRFKVQYLNDTVNAQLQPICHEAGAKSFTEDADFLRALSLATDLQRKEYAEKGSDIEAIRKEFYELKETGLDYDCFLCAKVTEDGRDRLTDDAITANDLYYFLKDKGYKPFFSERELKGLSGVDYEARILYALYQSECMLLVCSDEKYLETPWVKNEYTRFLRLLDYGEKEKHAVSILFNGVPIDRLPGKRGKIQGIDLKEHDAYLEALAFVERHTPAAKKRREEEEKSRQRYEEEILRRQRELEEELKKMQELTRRRAEAESLQNEAAAKEEAAASDGAKTEKSERIARRQAESAKRTEEQNFLIRAKQETEAGRYSNAKAFYTRVLNRNPECAEAWWGRFLLFEGFYTAEAALKNFNAQTAQKLSSSAEYKNARRYAEGEFKQYLTSFDALVKERTQQALEAEKVVYKEAKDRKNRLLDRKSRLVRRREELTKRYDQSFDSGNRKRISLIVLFAVFGITGLIAIISGGFSTGAVVMIMLAVVAGLFAKKEKGKKTSNTKKAKPEELSAAEEELADLERELVFCQKNIDEIVSRLNACDELLKLIGADSVAA